MWTRSSVGALRRRWASSCEYAQTASRLALASGDVDLVAPGKDLGIGAGMALSRGDVADAAVAVLMVGHALN